jgi:hypothetical protein
MNTGIIGTQKFNEQLNFNTFVIINNLTNYSEC